MTRLLEHEEIQDLLGVYAVSAIEDPAERAAVQAHLAQCAACRTELDEHREALRHLTAATERTPDAVWAAIRSAIEDEAPQEAPLAVVRPIAPHLARRALAATAAGAAALAAAASVAIMLALSGGDGLGPAERLAQVVPASAASASLTGDVRLYDSASPAARIVIELKGVPNAPSGYHYEVWVLRPGTAEMEAVGAFTPVDGRARLDLRLPGPGEYVAVDISVQENGGPPTHSGKSLAGAKLQ